MLNNKNLINIEFKNDEEKKIILKFQKIFDDDLKKAGFMKNGKIDKKKINNQYNQDYLRYSGLIDIENKDKQVNSGKTLKDVKIILKEKNIDYKYINIFNQNFIGFFFNIIYEGTVTKPMFDNYNKYYLIKPNNKSKNRFFYFDNNDNLLKSSHQKYDFGLLCIDNSEITIFNFSYYYIIDIKNDKFEINYKINWDENNTEINKIMDLLKITYLLNTNVNDWIANYFEDLKKICNAINYDNYDNFYDKIDFYKKCYITIYNNYKNKTKEDILKLIKNQIIEKIKKNFLIINLDEEQKDFEYNDIKSILISIKIQKPSFIIVCTQNCKSSGNKHFQHILRENLEKSDYELLMKNSKLNNIRTIIYYKKNSNIIFNEEKRFFSKNRIAKKITNLKKEENIFYIQKISNAEITDKKYGNGLIIISLEIAYNKKEFKFIFVNCNSQDEKNKTNEFSNIIDYILDKYLDYNIFISENFNFSLNNCKENKYINSISLLLKFKNSNRTPFDSSTKLPVTNSNDAPRERPILNR